MGELKREVETEKMKKWRKGREGEKERERGKEGEGERELKIWL